MPLRARLAGGPSASARRRTTGPPSRTSAAPRRASPPAASAANACVASASATAVTSARSRASTASVMTSPASATRGRCAQVSRTTRDPVPIHTRSSVASGDFSPKARQAELSGWCGWCPTPTAENRRRFSLIPLSPPSPCSWGAHRGRSELGLRGTSLLAWHGAGWGSSKVKTVFFFSFICPSANTLSHGFLLIISS